MRRLLLSGLMLIVLLLYSILLVVEFHIELIPDSIEIFMGLICLIFEAAAFIRMIRL